MRIGFFVNDIKTEEPGYTTTRLAMAALNRGHEAWVMDAESFAYDPDEKIRARARSTPKSQYKSSETYLEDLKGKKARQERITVDDLDVLMLRNDPSTDSGLRSWAQTVGINFGRIAVRHGVIVVNDPNGPARQSEAAPPRRADSRPAREMSRSARARSRRAGPARDAAIRRSLRACPLQTRERAIACCGHVPWGCGVR